MIYRLSALLLLLATFTAQAQSSKNYYVKGRALLVLDQDSAAVSSFTGSIKQKPDYITRIVTVPRQNRIFMIMMALMQTYQRL